MDDFKETEIGRIPSSWDVQCLEDLCEFVTDGAHKSPKIQEGGGYMASVKDMRYNHFDFSECKTISKEDFLELKKGNCSPKFGDILISKDGANCLDIIFEYRQPEEIVLLSSIAIARIKSENSSTFFRYFLLSPNCQYIMRNQFISGSAIPRVILKDFKKVLLPVPDLKEQQAIAEVLSSLDDKIDLLQRQNQTLEQMAETLFRQWFIEEAKEEWDYVSLANYITIYNGVSYKSTDLNPSKIAMVTLKSFARNGGFRLDGFKEYTGKYKEQHVVCEGDLVVAHTDITQDAALIGNPVLVIGRPEYETLIISMDLVKVESNYEWLSKVFLYFLMRTRSFKEHCVGYSNGSTVLHLSKDAVPSYEFLIPPTDQIIEFTSVVNPMIQKINQNISHIRNLEQQRDTLLPKLMSGEVRVKLN